MVALEEKKYSGTVELLANKSGDHPHIGQVSWVTWIISVFIVVLM